MNDSDGVDIDACGDTALGSSQVLREVGVHGLRGPSHQAVLVHHSQPRDEEVWVELIRNAPSPEVEQVVVFVPPGDWFLQGSKTRQSTQTPRQRGAWPEVDHREPVAPSEDDVEMVGEDIPQRLSPERKKLWSLS